LGFAYEQKGDYAGAAQTYRQFMTDHAEHFLAPRIQLALGRSLAMSNQPQAAQEALGHLIDLYPTSPWAENARQIMDKLKTP
jgi:TolA-binding protein